jgi:integrase
MTRKLTAKIVDSIRPGERVELWDTQARGFGLRASKSARTYVVRYRTRPRAGSTERSQLRRLTIGRADNLSLADARQMARDVLGRVARGEDPQAERVTVRRSHGAGTGTFRDLAAGLVLKAKLGDRTRYNWTRLLETLVYPRLGDRVPGEITRPDVRDLVDKIAEKTPTQANDVLKVIRWVFAKAVEKDKVQGSPCLGIRKPTKEEPRDRVATNAELRALWAAAEGEGLYGKALQLALLTAARREEVFSASWSEIDSEEKLWTIPGARTKNSRAHEVPLHEDALDLLGDRGEGWVFRGRLDGRPLRPTSKAWDSLVKVAKLEAAGLRFHDLRRTVRDRLTRDLGVALPVAEAVIGHVPAKLIRTYNPSGVPLKDKRNALARCGRSFSRAQERSA